MPNAQVSAERRQGLAGNLWGGLAAMLVALPAAIAFGVTIHAPLGGGYAAYGALAGILGAVALGLVAPAFGGTQRMISAPCAPAAALLAAFAVEIVQRGADPQSALVMLALIGLGAGLAQIAFGAIGLGRLIKYMPYPVVSGYLTAVGLTIIVGQLPRWLGSPREMAWLDALANPSAWQWQAIAVGAVTAAVMLCAERFVRAVPAAIVGAGAGVLAYFAMALADPRLLALAGNALVIGSLDAGGGALLEALAGRARAAAALELDEIYAIAVPALTLAVLLSIDTLKTCLVVDALTRSRHQSNRELIGQGLANAASALLGGIPGAGTMGPTLVSIASGSSSRLAGIFEGVLCLAAFLLLGALIAWVPIAALAGILIVIGVKMIDWASLGYLKSRYTALDFVVIAAVVAVALSSSLIAAAAVGIVLAILLFLREQIGGSVVRRKSYGNRMFSKQVRVGEERDILEREGGRTAIFELQGSLFFGTTDTLYTALESDLATCRYLILDMGRVQSVDVTAAHLLEQVKAALKDRGAVLIFTHVPSRLPTGLALRRYLGVVGLAGDPSTTRSFDDLDQALEWVEARILDEAHLERRHEHRLELREIELFARRKDETLSALQACMEQRSLRAGERIFAHGEAGDELFLVRRGAVRIQLPLPGGGAHHLGTFGRGSFFGEMSFLDREPRSAEAIAYTDTDLFVLSRGRFDAFSDEHKRLAANLLEALARALAIRLRYANVELSALQSA